MFPQIVAGTVFLYCAVVIAADDYTFRIVSDRILAILFTTGALYGLLAKDNFGEDFENTISGLALRSAIPGLSALLLALIYKFARGRDGLGLGDIKLIAAAGSGCRSSAASMRSRSRRSPPSRAHSLSRYGEGGRPRFWTRCRLRSFLRLLSGFYGFWGNGRSSGSQLKAIRARLARTPLPIVRQAHHEDQLVENTRAHPERVEG